MKKRFSILLAAVLLLTACSKIPVPSLTVPAETAPVKAEYADGVIGGDAFYGSRKEAAATCAVYAADGVPAPMPEAEYSYFGENGPAPAAGLLTAREWCDRKDLSEFRKFLAEQQDILTARALSFGSFVEIKGLPALAKVQILGGQTVLAEGVSDVNGHLMLAAAEDADRDGLVLAVNGQEQTRFSTRKGELTLLTVEEGGTQTAAVKELDFMLMVDTTGSMGDELEYLKKELENVIEAVYRLNPALSIRTSVNFYRDEGDEYVVKYYDFREDVQEAVALIEAQHSSGGGDYPEAVHTALDNAVFGHSWREGAVKLCYLVLDAPPHHDGDYADVQDPDAQTRKRLENINASLKASVAGAAAAGIRIIPVVASGADKDLETLGRSWAFLTGGTYIYLTNDSGIGSWHETPEVPETELEYLNDCMIRVTAEYCGLSYQAERHPQPSERQREEVPDYRPIKE